MMVTVLPPRPPRRLLTPTAWTIIGAASIVIGVAGVVLVLLGIV